MPHATGPTLRPDPTQKITHCDGLEERTAILATALTEKLTQLTAIAPLIMTEAVLAASCKDLVLR